MLGCALPVYTYTYIYTHTHTYTHVSTCVCIECANKLDMLRQVHHKSDCRANHIYVCVRVFI
jgi:hypothetical protein